MFNAFQQQRSSSPSPSQPSISPSTDSDLIFSMSPLTLSPISSPLSQNRSLKRTSASSTIIPTTAVPTLSGAGTGRTRVRESSPLPLLPKRLFPSTRKASMNKDTGGSKDFMYSLPRSFTPHPLLKRAPTVPPSVSISTQPQPHNAATSSSKTLNRVRPIQKETTPTPTRPLRSSTTPKPRGTHSVPANTNTNSSNTRIYREAYPSPPTSPSPSPPSSLRRTSFGSFEPTAIEGLGFGVATAGETTPPDSDSSRAPSQSPSRRLSSPSLLASYYDKPPQSSLSSEWSQSFYSHSHSRSRSASNSTSTSTSASGSMSSVNPIPIPHATARRSVSDSYLYLTNSSSASRSRSSQNKCIRGRSSVRRVYQPTMMKTSVVAPQLRNELPSGFWASEDGLEPEDGQQEEEELEPEELQCQHVVAPLSPLPSFRESSAAIQNGDEMRGRSWGRVGIFRVSASASSARMEVEEGTEMGLELEYDVSGLRSAFEHSDDDDGEYYAEEQAEHAAVARYDDEEGCDDPDEERTVASQEGDPEDMPTPATLAEQCRFHMPHQPRRHHSPVPMHLHMHDQLDFGLDFDLNSTLVEGESNLLRPVGWARRAHLLVPALASATRGWA